MRKTLNRLLLGSLVVAGSIFSGCEAPDTDKMASDITGKKSAYDEALEITKNPEKLFESPSENRNLEWYFLQGNELKGMEKAPSLGILKITTEPYPVKNPYFLTQREITRMWENKNLQGILEAGGEEYVIREEPDWVRIGIFVCKFEDSEAAEKQSKRLRGGSSLFKRSINNNLLDEKYVIQVCINGKTTLSQKHEDIYRESVRKYQERTGAKLLK